MELLDKLTILADAAKVRRGVHLQRAGSGGPARRPGEHPGRRMLPLLLRRRPVHLPAQGAAYQPVRLRLRLLRQPPLQRCAPGRLHPTGAGGAHHRLLPAQLHRGTLPLLRRVGRPRPHHRGHDRGPAPAAGGVRLPRLYPRQGHPGGRPLPHPAAGPAGRPPVRQHRAAQRGRAWAAWRPTRPRPPSWPLWPRSGMAFRPAGGAGPVPPRPRFAPAGQSTQMIIGATPESDRHIPHPSPRLSTTSTSSSGCSTPPTCRCRTAPSLPARRDFKPPLLREHRLYQADWLLRFYHFRAEELLDEAHPNFNPLVDPKCSWALSHPEFFPVEVNRADYEAPAAGAGYRGDLRPAHPGCPPVRAPHLCGAEKAGGGAQAGPVFPSPAAARYLEGLRVSPDGVLRHLVAQERPMLAQGARSSSPSSSRRVRRRPWTGHRFPMPMTAALPAFDLCICQLRPPGGSP